MARVTADEDGARKRRAAHLGPERRRPLLLDAALGVFLEHGYRGTSMQAVATAAGVTKPVVYECFPNKDALLLALLDREERRLLDAVVAAMPRTLSTSDALGDLVAAGLAAFLTAATEADDAWRIVFSAQHDPRTVIGARVKAARAMLVDRLRDIIHPQLRVMPHADADREAPVLAELVASLAETSARMLVVDRIPWSVDELSRYVATLLVRD
ncbi:hypothetical protein HUW46_07301 [Amycolatopsis sp. CA-230715]|nr:hypothetical protein HUW46_07301 [Amycolatopsis sp. CA-230715]